MLLNNKDTNNLFDIIVYFKINKTKLSLKIYILILMVNNILQKKNMQTNDKNLLLKIFILKF
jgi:hypothetical protein